MELYRTALHMAHSTSAGSGNAALFGRLREAVSAGVVAEIALWNPSTIGGFTISNVRACNQNAAERDELLMIE